MRATNILDDGFHIVDEVLLDDNRATLVREFESLLAGAPGDRDGLRSETIRALTKSLAIRALVEPVLGPHAFAYRATLFDKNPTTNWLVAWHQDLTVPVREQRRAIGYGPWSQKRGRWFVQPPAAILGQLLAVRIDLDGSDAMNGALRVLPGTHRHGVVPPDRIAELATQVAPVTCCVPCRGALLMRPLLLHASSRATRPSHRRVVHVEFAAAPLPDGLSFPDAG